MLRFVVLIFLFSAQFALAQNSEPEVIVDGEMSLIKRNNMFFLLRKGTTNYIHLAGRYKSILAKQLADCPIVAGMVDKDKEKLPELIRAYNACKGGSNPDLIDVEQPWRFAIMAGTDFTTTTFQNSPSAEVRYLDAVPMYDRSFFQFGTEAIYKSHKVSNLIGFYGGIFYNRNDYYQVSKRHLPLNVRDVSVDEYNEHSLTYSELKIPIGLEFSRPTKKKVAYHLRLGLAIPKVLNFSATHDRYDIIINNEVHSEVPSNIVEFKRKLILSGTVGCDLRTSDRTRIRVQASWSGGYHKATAQNKLASNSAPGFSSSISFMTGFIF